MHVVRASAKIVGVSCPSFTVAGGHRAGRRVEVAKNVVANVALAVAAVILTCVVGCNSTCSSSSQCSGGKGCVPPAAGRCGGGISPCAGNDPCNTDSDCADSGLGPFCQPVQCQCGAFAGLCGVDCNSAILTMGCPLGHVGQTCQGGHCSNNTCATDSDCIANFTCDPTSHTCQAKPCQTDGDCNGYCVDNQCASQPGMCVPVPG